MSGNLSENRAHGKQIFYPRHGGWNFCMGKAVAALADTLRDFRRGQNKLDFFAIAFRENDGSKAGQYRRLLEQCDSDVYLHEDYKKEYYLERNRYMVDQATYCSRSVTRKISRLDPEPARPSDTPKRRVSRSSLCRRFNSRPLSVDNVSLQTYIVYTKKCTFRHHVKTADK